MPKIALRYDVLNEKSRRTGLHNDIIDTLDAVRRLGSLTAAAEELGVSYRHLWNELNAWEEELGISLLVRGRGKSGELSEAAKRLLWAEKEVQAKYAEQISALRSGIERAFQLALSEQSRVLQLRGCPDMAVAQLRDRLADRARYMDISFSSSLAGLKTLNEGKCDLAGFNFPMGSGKHSEAAKLFKPHIKGLTIIRFATRIQGIAVAQGNPLSIHSLLDISMKKARYVNRAEGTGTRVLLEELMHSAGLSGDDINGYNNLADSHTLVATKIASGQADAGLCIASAARNLDLDFVPLVKEIYYLACKPELIESAEGKALLNFLSSDEFKEDTAHLAGYDFADCGKVAKEIFT